MKKILITSLISLMLASIANADTDGVNNLSKKSKPVKDCFESLNRATFSLNQGLDKFIFKPVAKEYRSLPSSIRNGTSNALVNISSLITIPTIFYRENLKLRELTQEDLLSIQSQEFLEYLM